MQAIDPGAGGNGSNQDGSKQLSGLTPTLASTLAGKLAATLTKQKPSKRSATKIGDNLTPVPPKLAARIIDGDFVAMYELLPECLADSGYTSKPAAKARAKKRVQDVNAWLQCFALYVGVLGPKRPDCIPQMMSYLVTIVRASQEFEGSAWALYDDYYRRQAAAAGHWQWSEVNPSLYSMCFTGKAKRMSRCDRCLSVAHKSEDCVLPGDDDPDVARRLKTIESAVVALTQPGGSSDLPRNPVSSSEVCLKFNWNECRFRACKYAHRCAGCRGPHPASQCSVKPPPDQGGNAAPWGRCDTPCSRKGHPRVCHTSRLAVEQELLALAVLFFFPCVYTRVLC